MVYISRITFTNFKSFNGSVKLTFQQGFNVITGPNGSGKSNIIDAVQFVFGELGSKRMRVPDLAGLIFDGAGEDGSKPRYSQVTIYFNNTDRGLAIDRKTVSVGRRVDRQGKSKYFLNGKRTSRRRLLDLLEMAGISPGGYNMVLQGMATRLSDLTPSERMNALEDLIGITEYDEKKAEARVRLSEAERKIEVASAKGDEVRKRVNRLERERNDALRHRLLEREEKKLGAYVLSDQINRLEANINETKGRISENDGEIEGIEAEKSRLYEERDAARERLEEVTNEAAVRGNTRLPLLKSELVEKRSLRRSLEKRLEEIDQRKISLEGSIEHNKTEIDRSKIEKEEKKRELKNLVRQEAKVAKEIGKKDERLQEFAYEISTQRENVEDNQKRIEQLTEDLVPMQESLSGLEIEINGHLVSSNSLKAKIEDLERKKNETLNSIGSFKMKIGEYEALKVQEAEKLEDMLETIEEQVKRQKGIRDTIRGANKLAKEAELTITQFTAKRDLWKNVVTEEKALERIREMGESGALKGYHGPLRSLVKIDLKHQRAANMASSGWSNAIVVDNLATVIFCVEGLKKNKLGMTRFIPLRDNYSPNPLPDLKEPGVVGYLPKLIRFEAQYESAVYLIWGDTYLVENRTFAIDLARKGFRTVTMSGDLFEPKGGIMGGHWRRPTDFTKLIPSDESIFDLSRTIKTLRARLSKRMGELKKSGGSLREFTGYTDHFNKNIDGIDQQIRDTLETIQRLDRNITIIDGNLAKISEGVERELGLVATLRERKERTIQEIERTKKEITNLRGLKPSDITGMELKHDTIAKEIAELRNQRAQFRTDISVQTSLIDRYLMLKTLEQEGQIKGWRSEIRVLDREQREVQANLGEESSELEELEKVLKGITSEVEATSRILEQHRKAVTRLERQIERLDQRRTNIDRRSMSLNLELEKLRLRVEQRFEELVRIGFEDVAPMEGVDLARVESTLQKIHMEKRSLGMINQLAIQAYMEDAYNYKMLSVRINELEEEKGSILNFIDEVEREKQEHFMKAFNEICENFSNLFAKLTGGGDGRIELQKPEDPFSGGVDLYVQFPGKPMRLVSGASGGERSVAAIAYLLAVQRFLKAPFYLFDEIDAHLDDVNTARLADVLKENALEAQFLMVSLKDVMVHNADKIYGVFAQSGRSRVVALPMTVEVPV
ncbi:MAG: chromosome segregation protein SMC [Candidatus Bathyarchaeota archaeon]|nr:MAG: chromosome segregation protein SMC [Candidatus Bathyarchaeota archaeon]